ncbi:MAG TPA: hypothetical protein ENI23_08470 [bacterium]|nr:hypothetical protein [bacterium]
MTNYNLTLIQGERCARGMWPSSKDFSKSIVKFTKEERENILKYIKEQRHLYLDYIAICDELEYKILGDRNKEKCPKP